MNHKIKLFLYYFAICLATINNPVFGQQQQINRDKLSGGFFQFTGMTSATIPPYLDEMKSLGMDTLVTVGTLTCDPTTNSLLAPHLSSTTLLHKTNRPFMGTGINNRPNGLKVALPVVVTATQSSTYPIASASANSAIDNNIDGNFYNGSVTTTNLDLNAWWEEDLGISQPIDQITIWNRTDCCNDRLNDFWVFVSDTPFLPTDTPTTLQNRPGTWNSHHLLAPNPSLSIFTNGYSGRYVRIQLSGTNYLSLAEIQIVNSSDVVPNGYKWLEPGNPELIGVLLSEAQNRGIKVQVGLIASEGCASQVNDFTQAGWLIDYLVSKFGQYNSLAGWYIGDEPYLQDNQWYASEISYYQQMAASIRKHSNLPISVSPYLVSYSAALGNPPGNPTNAAATALQFLNDTGVNVLIYEDGMGGRTGQTLQWISPPTIADYFSAISKSIGSQRLWIVHEIFNSTFGIGGGYGSASITRLNQQIAMVPDSLIGKRFTWTHEIFMSLIAPNRNPEADRLLTQYKATHSLLIPDQQLIPTQISWGIPFTIPDGTSSLSFLTDSIVGDPFNSATSAWSTVTGESTLYVDLGNSHIIDWVNLYTAKQAANGIQTPQYMLIYSSIDGNSWQKVASRTFASGSFDGEYDIGNIQAMNAIGRYLMIHLGNTGTTKISEVEVFGR